VVGQKKYPGEVGEEKESKGKGESQLGGGDSRERGRRLQTKETALVPMSQVAAVGVQRTFFFFFWLAETMKWMEKCEVRMRCEGAWMNNGRSEGERGRMKRKRSQHGSGLSAPARNCQGRQSVSLGIQSSESRHEKKARLTEGRMRPNAMCG